MDSPLVLVLVAVVVVAAVVSLVISRRRRALPPPDVPTARAVERPSMGARLSTARAGFGDRVRDLIKGSVDAETLSSLEEVLLSADVGLSVTTDVVRIVEEARPADAAEAHRVVHNALSGTLADGGRAVVRSGDPSVVLVVGANGVGKTTTIAKLAARLREGGASPILAAADTFRAAADTQLAAWADRVGVEVVRGESGSDPAAVAFEGVKRARERGNDTVIVDTAGRLHSKKNLMEELGKIVRVLEREATIDETLLVLDGTAGQNGLAQARAFGEVTALTGVVLTKMDGSAKGGIAFAVERELGVPVKFIGLGEGVDDLVAFDPEAYVDAILEGS